MRNLILLISIFMAPSTYAQLTYQSPSSPASTTTNAFSLWGDTTGGSLLDSSLLFDGSSIAGGLTGTIAPTVSSTSKTWTLPNVSGGIFVSGQFQTFNSNFIGEANQWFNNSDTSKRMTFDLSNMATGKTVSMILHSPLVGTAGSTGSIAFPGFAVGETTYTLMKTTNADLSAPIIQDYYNMDDDAGNVAVTTKYTGGLRVFNNSNNLDFYDANGDMIHVSGYIRTEVDWGSTPLTEKTFTMADDNATATDPYQGVSKSVFASVARATVTGKTYIDENDMDSFYIACSPGSGNVTCLVRCLTGQYSGKMKIDYRIANESWINNKAFGS